MKIIKAHCVKQDKWFLIAVDDRGQIVNVENASNETAKAYQTQVKGTSFQVSSILRPCMKCGSRKAGCCSHVADWQLCDQAFFYQCLFCDQLRISLQAADSRYSPYKGQSNIQGAEVDQYGNPLGAQYDLAKNDGFRGFKIVIICQYTGQGMLEGIKQPIAAMKKKGFEVELYTSATPGQLEQYLKGACQLWVISDYNRCFNDGHLTVIRDFYHQGHGLYLFGDNDPYNADVNYLGKELFNTTMSGDYQGDRVIGVSEAANSPGIIKGHLISTGIVNLFEGITIAQIRTSPSSPLVKPLVYSSNGQVVTAYVDDGRHRALLDGGFTRLYCKWDTAGTDRFIVNAAAWLANAEDDSEVRFT